MPLPALLAALAPGAIGGIASLFQTGINARVARENTDKTIDANRKLAEYQYSKDVEMWNRGNVYNAPQAQMERLKKAGLNPNLAYGSGNVAGQASGQLPKYNAPTQEYNYQPPVDLPSMISQFQNFRVANAQMRALDNENDIKRQALQIGDVNWSIKRNQEVIGKKQIDLQDIINRTRQQQYEFGAESQGFKRELFGSQKQFQEGRLYSQTLEQQRLIEQTRNLDLQNEYFAAKAITGLFGGIVGSVGTLGKMGYNFFRGGKGALAPGTLKGAKSVLPGFRNAPRVTPKTEMGRTHPAYRQRKKITLK